MKEQLKLPAPQFRQLPTLLQVAADNAQIKIVMELSRAIPLPPSEGILVTRDTFPAKEKYSGSADTVIFSKPIEFVRTDNTIKKIKVAIWYFGGNSQNFIEFFGQFGVAYCPIKAETPANTDGQ